MFAWLVCNPLDPWQVHMCLAVPGRIEEIFEDRGVPMGKVNFGGVVKQVCLAYLPEIRVGEYAIVHVGFAISRVDERTAQETLATFEQLGLLEEEFETSPPAKRPSTLRDSP